MSATTGDRAKPIPRAIGSRTANTASVPISKAATTAMTFTTSMPVTHWTVVVERATVNVRRRTNKADDSRPPPMAASARPQIRPRRSSVLSKAASGPASRPSGDTYRIPCPHEAREVVALAHHIQVDVLAEVEARVLVGPAEAGHVQVEHDEGRAAASHRLQQAHPLWIRARRDHGDGAAGQPANAVPRQRLGQRGPAVGLTDREVVEDQAVLAHRAVRLEHRAARVVGDQTHLAAATVHLRGHRRSQAHRVLDRRLLPVTEMHAAVEVQEDPEVRGQRLLERLRHQALVLRRQRPVDAPEVIPCDVVPYAARFRRVVGPRTERLRGTDLLRAGSHQVRHWPHARIDQNRRALRDLELAVEQAKGFADTQRGRPQRHPAPPSIDATRPPLHDFAAERDDAPGLIVGDLAEVTDLDPRPWDPALSPHLELLLVHLPDGWGAGVDAPLQRHSLNRGERLAGVEEVESATRAGAECDLRIAAGPTHQPRDVLAQLRLDEDIGHCSLGRRQLVR